MLAPNLSDCSRMMAVLRYVGAGCLRTTLELYKERFVIPYKR
jgi:hypothetical protein